MINLPNFVSICCEHHTSLPTQWPLLSIVGIRLLKTSLRSERIAILMSKYIRKEMIEFVTIMMMINVQINKGSTSRSCNAHESFLLQLHIWLYHLFVLRRRRRYRWNTRTFKTRGYFRRHLFTGHPSRTKKSELTMTPIHNDSPRTQTPLTPLWPFRIEAILSSLNETTRKGKAIGFIEVKTPMMSTLTSAKSPATDIAKKCDTFVKIT